MYLNCHSYYSLRYGTLSPEQLVQEAKARGITCLALTDIHRSSGVFDFVQACETAGIKPVVGMEFEAGYVSLARNEAGFLQINDFATKYLV
jgi:DNA polymerase-3 subunit alpha